MPNLSCRFYERKFPKIDEVVMATVLSIAEMGAYVHLLEYNKIEGMILLSELSRRRIRSINKLIRVGKDECVVVIRVDEDKGYIDLSKRRVSPEEVHGCYAKFSNAKCVNSILCHVGQLLKYETDAQLEELYKKTAWMFDKKFKKDGASFDSFKKAVMNPSILDECDIDAETKEVLLENIKRRLTPHAVKIRSDVEVLCYEYEGVDAVKRALGAGIDLSTADMPIKINLIAPPLYVVTTQTLDRGLGVKRVEEALVKIKESIEKEGGKFSVKMQPKVVSDVDELELAERMEKLKKANEEVSGDEDSEEETGDEEEEEEDDAAAAAAVVAASGGIDGGDEASKEGEESK